METIHDHDVVAERLGTVGEIRSSHSKGTHSERDAQTTLAAWLLGLKLGRPSSRRPREPRFGPRQQPRMSPGAGRGPRVPQPT